MTAKAPTPQGISRLLAAAGFPRSNHGKPGVMWNEVSTGFVCWKTYHKDHPEQPYVAVQHDIEGMMSGLDDEDRAERNAEMRTRLEEYAKVIRDASYHALIRDRGQEPPCLTILTLVKDG